MKSSIFETDYFRYGIAILIVLIIFVIVVTLYRNGKLEGYNEPLIDEEKIMKTVPYNSEHATFKHAQFVYDTTPLEFYPADTLPLHISDNVLAIPNYKNSVSNKLSWQDLYD